MIQQLNPPIPVFTPKGNGLAHLIIDEGIEHDIKWVVFLDRTGECWTYSNRNIRAQTNTTHGRENISPFYDPQDVALKKENDCDEYCTCDVCGDCTDDCDCERKYENDVDWERAYREKSEEYEEKKLDLKDACDENIKIRASLTDLKVLIKKLLTDDQIHPNQRDEVKRKLNNMLEEDELPY